MHKIQEVKLKPLIIAVTLLYLFLEHQHMAIIKNTMKFSNIEMFMLDQLSALFSTKSCLY